MRVRVRGQVRRRVCARARPLVRACVRVDSKERRQPLRSSRVDSKERRQPLRSWCPKASSLKANMNTIDRLAAVHAA
eukprot:4216880-Pleurochrysis_carterae.AAC.1